MPCVNHSNPGSTNYGKLEWLLGNPEFMRRKPFVVWNKSILSWFLKPSSLFERREIVQRWRLIYRRGVVKCNGLFKRRRLVNRVDHCLVQRSWLVWIVWLVSIWLVVRLRGTKPEEACNIITKLLCLLFNIPVSLEF